MSAATRRSSRQRRAKGQARAARRPSAWERLAAHIAEPSSLHDTTMQKANPGIADALAIIRHAGPGRHQVGSLIVAQGLLIGELIEIARQYLSFEEPVVEVVNLLHEHIQACGFISDCEGGYVKDASWPADLEESVTAFRNQLERGFPGVVVAGTKPAEEEN